MNSKYKNKIYLQEFQKWINTDGYIGYVGCSFTWGQGLWNYDKDNLDKENTVFAQYFLKSEQN